MKKLLFLTVVLFVTSAFSQTFVDEIEQIKQQQLRAVEKMSSPEYAEKTLQNTLDDARGIAIADANIRAQQQQNEKMMRLQAFNKGFASQPTLQPAEDLTAYLAADWVNPYKKKSWVEKVLKDWGIWIIYFVIVVLFLLLLLVFTLERNKKEKLIDKIDKESDNNSIPQHCIHCGEVCMIDANSLSLETFECSNCSKSFKPSILYVLPQKDVENLATQILGKNGNYEVSALNDAIIHRLIQQDKQESLIERVSLICPSCGYKFSDKVGMLHNLGEEELGKKHKNAEALNDEMLPIEQSGKPQHNEQVSDVATAESEKIDKHNFQDNTASSLKKEESWGTSDFVKSRWAHIVYSLNGWIFFSTYTAILFLIKGKLEEETFDNVAVIIALLLYVIAYLGTKYTVEQAVLKYGNLAFWVGSVVLFFIVLIIGCAVVSSFPQQIISSGHGIMSAGQKLLIMCAFTAAINAVALVLNVVSKSPWLSLLWLGFMVYINPWLY